MKLSVVSAWVSIFSGLLALVLLVTLHFVSSEFDPSFRMISEYALGNHAAILSGFFFTWALSTFVLLFAVGSQVKGIGGKIGLVFLFLGAIGMTMGGLYDIRHPLHGAAFGLGVPALPIAAVLITLSLVRQKGWDKHKKLLLWTAHLTWVSLIFMALTMFLFISSYMQAGGVMDSTPRVHIELPDGVIAVVGWFNRLLVISYIVWVIKTAWISLKVKGKK
ncbi:MAG TPA: DUF998 domain-containing protein [Patescibacteria group bacterium]|nr:DUF998 domain-containing protein [Patescibacteria group bacterium]